MEILRFVHRFFHFESSAWKKAIGRETPSWDLARSFFSEPVLPRRELRGERAPSFDAALAIHERSLALEDSLGIRVLNEEMPTYPAAIRAYVRPENRPALLYLRGMDVAEENQTVAVVGTRKPSDFGREATASFATYFTALGFHLASGLAKGIDAIAHERGLAKGSLAVLGSGVAQVYPEENQYLAEKLLSQGGTLLSPFPMEQVPLPQNFPARNELISALSAGVVVIEGAEKSGAAITGRQALAMGKAVVGLTQDFRSEFGRGAIRLQQDGATLVTREEEAVEAIFSRFGGFQGRMPKSAPLPPKKAFSFSEFQAATKLDVPAALALLEEGLLHGRIERVGSLYRRRSSQ